MAPFLFTAHMDHGLPPKRNISILPGRPSQKLAVSKRFCQLRYLGFDETRGSAVAGYVGLELRIFQDKSDKNKVELQKVDKLSVTYIIFNYFA